MNTTTRRIVLGLGAALLVGGWGVIHYADQRQLVFTTPLAEYLWPQDRANLATEVDIDRMNLIFLDLLVEGVVTARSRLIAGSITMAIGAGLIGFGAVKSEPPKT